ncbi:hypothetical protein EVJ58_g6225 [Rhodofomes roseus]|uniref:SWIRM domain-containing protein n=1 Tax=Rhodofomes roseus TaxID=34475 RepID=A0A4Y9Y8R3_9APHY|nr:hypothetical protein EVJ58_g6225 [Rhodofomes roseus]
MRRPSLVHEVATFLPGRLEFEHELDNEAEDLVKDLEFGVCLQWDGDQIPEDENDLDVKARAKWEEELKAKDTPAGKHLPNGAANGLFNGHVANGSSPSRESRGRSEDTSKADGNADETEVEEQTQPPPIETPDSLGFKLSLIESYNQRIDKRLENKAFMFDRGLLNYKQMQAAEKKRPKEEKDIVHRLRPFARLQTAQDFEEFCADILYESLLRKRITELQHYRRMGLTTVADIDKYEADAAKRTQAKTSLSRDYYPERLPQLRAPGGRQSSVSDVRTERGKSHERESTPNKPGGSAHGASGTGPPGRKMRMSLTFSCLDLSVLTDLVFSAAAPLNLANSPLLHLLTPEEQTLCSQLRILPKPYLVIKETLVREYARRGGKLRRREARDLVKIDVNKTSRVWDFLVQAGFLRVGPVDPGPSVHGQDNSRPSATPSLSASPSKESQMQSSPRPLPFTTTPLGSFSSAAGPSGS